VRVRIVHPVHLNPNMREPVHRLLDEVPNIILTPPLDYLPLVHLMKRSYLYLMLTDSGVIQEEAPGLQGAGAGAAGRHRAPGSSGGRDGPAGKV
jgi:UDP-N-acetylglucosamine 2-epimerase